MTTATKLHERPSDGVLLAPVGDDGVWGAFRSLREGLRDLADGRGASATFLSAISEEGRLADADAGDDAALLALGFRIED